MSNASKTFLDYYPYGRTEFVLTVNDVKNLNDKGQNSEKHMTGDIDWQLNVCLNKKANALAAYLFCDPVDIANWWKVNSQYRIVLENKKDAKQSVARQMDYLFESDTAENRGWNVFVPYDDVMDEEKGFLENGNLTFRVMIGVNSTEGFDTPKYFDFTFDDKSFCDAKLSVDGFVFHVNKMIMTVHSPVIGKLIMDAAAGSEVVLNDIDRHEFADFLQILYAVPIRIQKNNIMSLLKMADRFQTEGLKNMGELFLQQAESEGAMTMSEVIKVAEAYKLPSILNKVIDEAKSADELTKKFGNLDAFSPQTLKKVVSKTLTFTK